VTEETNTGYYNTGNYNTGYYNTGYYNTGYYNTGDHNTGDYNTGYYNTGDYNTGDYNTGHRNTGDYNTGNCNTGYHNTGHRNTGDYNTGHCNTGDYNTGHCNSVTPSEILVFNKPCSRDEWENATKPQWMYCAITKWVSTVNMTDKEKDAYPSYVTAGGYLKAYSSMKSAFVDAWENATEEDRELTKKLPNFDPHVFKEVFGFDPFKSDEPRSDCDGTTVLIDGKRYRLTLEE
jgi:hypothetical protein